MGSNHQTSVFGKAFSQNTQYPGEPPPVSLLSLTCLLWEPDLSPLSLTPSQKNVTLKDGCGHLSLVLTTEEDVTVTLLNHCANPEIPLSPSD